MKITQGFIALLLVPGFSRIGAVPAPQTNGPRPEVIPGKYIVSLKNSLSDEDVQTHRAWVQDVHRRNLAKRVETGAPAGVERTYEGNFVGYAGAFDEATVAEIKANDDVEFVEADQIWHLQAIQRKAPYDLAALSSRKPGAAAYRYDNAASGGLGYKAYVVDTGINTNHVEFQNGRATFGYNAAVGSPNNDTNGHGTHCAGIIASRSFGVAKRASVIAVKVFAGNSGSSSAVLEGYNYAVNEIVAASEQLKSLISISINGPFSPTLNGAVANAYNQGVLTVVSAGNQYGNATNYSPGSAPEALTVGSHDVNWERPESSNYGESVDIFAGGVSINSTWIGSNTATYTLSGTSQACPHVAGLAIMLRAAAKSLSANDTVNRIISLATVGALVNPGAGSSDRIANNGYIGS